MGGKSRKSGAPSKALIDRLEQGKTQGKPKPPKQQEKPSGGFGISDGGGKK